MTIYIDSKELENLSRKSTKQQLNMGGESHNFELKKKCLIFFYMIFNDTEKDCKLKKK